MIRLTTQTPSSKTTPKVRVLFAFEEEAGFANLAGSPAVRLRESLAREGFKGRESEGAWADFAGRPGLERVVAVGMGSREKCRVETYRRAGGRAARLAAQKNQDVLGVDWPSRGLKGDPGECAKAFAEGLILGSYRFSRYMSSSRKPQKDLEEVRFQPAQELTAVIRRALETASLYCGGVFLARDLINGAPSDVTPRVLADTARAVASKNKGVTVRVYGRKELERMGAGGLLGVNRGSAQEPYLIHLRYRPRRSSGKSVALVGKGITFDSGGLSLKPAGSMETMKMDMSGAAAVLGVFHDIARLDPRAEVHGVIAATENMPGGRAYKPGDVLKALNGKTMEVLNTDAEGRLILADALCYAERQKPDVIVDMATLTGACVIALGALVAGALGNDPVWMDRVKTATESEGETIWELPLVPEYRADLKSKVADIKNIGGTREAGTILGGLFLGEFVERAPWVHLDIAGPAWLDREYPAVPYLHPGGSGLMVRSLQALLKSL